MWSHVSHSRIWRQISALVLSPLCFITLWLGLVDRARAADTEKRPPITTLDLANIKDIGGHHAGAISVSPEGRFVAFQLQSPDIKARNYDLTWYIIETKPDGVPWRVDDGGDVILNPSMSWPTNGNRPQVEAKWSPHSEWIYYLKRIDGSTQLWRSRRDGSLSEQLTHNAADVLWFQLSDDGKEAFFTVAIPKMELSKQLQNEGDRGFLFDGRFHPRKRQKPVARDCGVNVWGYINRVTMERTCEPPLWVYSVAAKMERKATPNETETFRNLSFSVPLWQSANDRHILNERRNSDVIWIENENPEKFPGYRPPMRLMASLSGREFRCHAKECYGVKGVIEGAWWRSNQNELVFQRADGSNASMTSLYAWRPDTDELRVIKQMEDRLSDCEVIDSRAICLREQWTHPRTISSIDLDSGEVKTIYDPNPEFDRFQFSKIEKIEWRDQFGNPTHGHLVYPLNYEEGRRYPLVITTYTSRGFLRGATGDEYPIHVLAANGFMVLSYDNPSRLKRDAIIPLPTQSEYEDNHERRSKLSAQLKILDVLIERGLIDPNRIAITGLSDGAAQVAFALIHTDRFATAIASSAADFRSEYYYLYNEKDRAFRRRILGGAPYEDKKGLYKALSIGLNVESINAPFLINVSDRELVNSVESFVRLQDAGRPVEMHVFPREYHIKWQPQHRLAIYRRNVQWLKFWLMGKEEPDPVDSNQYERWRKLCSTKGSRLGIQC